MLGRNCPSLPLGGVTKSYPFWVQADSVTMEESSSVPDFILSSSAGLRSIGYNWPRGECKIIQVSEQHPATGNGALHRNQVRLWA